MRWPAPSSSSTRPSKPAPGWDGVRGRSTTTRRFHEAPRSVDRARPPRRDPAALRARLVFWNPMTKVQIRFRLQRPLDSVLLPRIAAAHAVYGIYRVTVSPSRESVTVEYDAPRPSPADVESALAGAGPPIAPG